MDAGRGGEAHQVVPRGVERNRVDTLAARIERRKLRRMAIRRIGKGERWRGAERDTPFADGALGPRAALARQRFLERGIVRIQIAVRVRRRLVRERWLRDMLMRACYAARARASSTTAARISAPPAICTGAMRSPSTMAASVTVTSGSSVDSVEARVGPMRFKPAK